MVNYQAKRAKKLVPHIRAWLAILALLAIFLISGRAAWNIYNKNQFALENRLAVVRELEDLENRQKIIKFKLDKLKTIEGQEEEIRKNLSMVKEGEYVITIVDNKNQRVFGEIEATSTEKIKSSFWDWLSSLMDK